MTLVHRLGIRQPGGRFRIRLCRNSGCYRRWLWPSLRCRQPDQTFIIGREHNFARRRACSVRALRVHRVRIRCVEASSKQRIVDDRAVGQDVVTHSPTQRLDAPRLLLY